MSVIRELGSLTPIGMAFDLAASDQIADMKAMNKFMVEQPAKTSQGAKLKTNWNVWYNDLSWYEISLDREIWMQARNRIADFKLANAATTAEKEAVERIAKQSAALEMESLAAQGKPAPINVETGKFITEDPRADEELKLKWVLLGATFTLVSGFAAYVSPVKKVPLAGMTMLGILGTGTYVAFKVD